MQTGGPHGHGTDNDHEHNHGASVLLLAGKKSDGRLVREPHA
jgi:hypothetical protein